MTRNRFNQANQALSNFSLSPSKARQLFLEDNDNIDLKDTYKITNVHPPLDEKDVVNKEYCDNNLLSSSNKMDILSSKITELRKGEFDKVTTKTLQLNETQSNDEQIMNLLNQQMKSQILLSFCKEVSADTISKYNHLKLEIDNNKFNQNINNIQLDEMFTTGLKEFKEVNKKTNSFIDEALLKNKRTTVQYIIAILLRSTLLDNKEQESLEQHYGFKQEDITNEIESFFY